MANQEMPRSTPDSSIGENAFRPIDYLPGRFLIIHGSLYEGAYTLRIDVNSGLVTVMPEVGYFRVGESELALIHYSGEFLSGPFLQILSLSDLDRPRFALNLKSGDRGMPQVFRIGPSSFIVLLRCITVVGCLHGLYRFDISLPGKQ
jgi:hypothetical protein